VILDVVDEPPGLDFDDGSPICIFMANSYAPARETRPAASFSSSRALVSEFTNDFV